MLTTRQVTNARLHEMETSPTTYNLAKNIGTNEFRVYKRLIDRTILRRTPERETRVELSYITSAGPDLSPFVLDECMRLGRTLITNLTLVQGAGGVIEETMATQGRRDNTYSGRQCDISSELYLVHWYINPHPKSGHYHCSRYIMHTSLP